MPTFFTSEWDENFPVHGKWICLERPEPPRALEVRLFVLAFAYDKKLAPFLFFKSLSLFVFVLCYLAMGQNLRYLFRRDYHLFKRLLRVTGGTGF